MNLRYDVTRKQIYGTLRHTYSKVEDGLLLEKYFYYLKIGPVAIPDLNGNSNADINISEDLFTVSDDVLNKYHKFQTKINHCINNGEAILRLIRDFNLRIKQNVVTEDEINNLEFMKLKEFFFDFLKSYLPVRSLENYSTVKKIKGISTRMHEYIEDRNKFTHGVLKYLVPDNVFLIESKNSKGKEVYKPVNEQTLVDYNNTSTYFKTLVFELDL